MVNFKVNKIINLYYCLYFILAKCVTKVAAFPAHNLSSCNCVLLESCTIFNTFIDKSSDERHIKNVIQDAVCFFDGLNIFVCCPDKFEHKRNAKERPKLDYLDELTGLNCPPSFGNEYNYDEYLRTYEVGPKQFNRHLNKPGNDYNHRDITASIGCDDSHNCDTFQNYDKFHSYHEYDHKHHHHNHGQDMHIPFFPHTHTNHDGLAYSTRKTTTTKSENEQPGSCGVLPSAINNSIEVYPWIIRLAYLNTTSRTIRYRCMGTIITDQHILTAAHCVDQLVLDLRLIYVRIGDDTDFEDYQILETIVHPNYNEPLFNNDLAILKLAKRSEKKDTFIQICLPKDNVLSGDTGVVAGWSSSTGISEIKNSTIRYINLPIMNNTECAIRYAKYSENFESSIVITPTEFCAKAEAMNDVCEGDSGGPFMERSKTGRYILLGIVAFGPKTNCGQSNLPGVYMRVASYVDWIKSKISSVVE